MIDIDILVDAYIECGEKHGFFLAETILAEFTPEVHSNLCKNVPPEKREACMAALKKGKI